MRGLSLGNKIVFLVNSLAAFLLLISYVLPYIPPKSFGTLSVLSLGVPLLILLNLMFFLYWLLKVKKQLILSLVVLLLGWSHISSMYKFSSSKQVDAKENFTVMSFNVRIFNEFKWSPSKTIRKDIKELIELEKPSILCLQEYTRGTPLKLKGDYYSFNARYTRGVRGGQAIFSKFPIVKSGSLEFPNTNNNAIFVDVVRQNDTIRIYTLHLQSSGINTEVEALKKESSESLFKRIGNTFKAQQDQVELLLKHKSKCSYKTIITGDFNNTAFSYIYKKIKGENLVDTFKEAGNGFGKTYDFKFFPLRIDFILADKDFTVNGFKTYTEKLSDHYPIKATLKLH